MSSMPFCLYNKRGTKYIFMHKPTFSLEYWTKDLPAGLVVFLVALPLCLGIALASGAPLYAGMIAGMVGGIVVSSISNSALSVSGPAAGLAAIVAISIQQLGAFPIFLLAVVFAGIFQICFGLVRAGILANYIPSSVIKGLLTAIGILIILKQIPHAFGYDADSEGDFEFFQTDGETTFGALISTLAHIDATAVSYALVSMAIILLWERPQIKKYVGAVPGALIAVIICTIVNSLFVSTNSAWAVSTEHLVKLPVPATFGEFIDGFTFPDFSQLTNKHVYIVAITLAVVASIETLLCIEAIDKIDPQKRLTSTNRELFAQGAANIVSGLIGGLPITSVIVRSSANANAGAVTRLSAIIHGVMLLVCAATIPSLLNKIPLASLAAILLLTGYKLANLNVFKEMFARGKYQFVPFIATVLGIVFTDLLIGIGIGIAVSVLAVLRENMKTAYSFKAANYEEGKVITIQLAEEVSFLNKVAIRESLDEIPDGSTVIIDASNSKYIDFDVLEILRDFATTNAPQNGINLTIKGLKEPV